MYEPVSTRIPKHPLHANPAFRAVLVDIEDRFSDIYGDWFQDASWFSPQDHQTTNDVVNRFALLKGGNLWVFAKQNDYPNPSSTAHAVAVRELLRMSDEVVDTVRPDAKNDRCPHDQFVRDYREAIRILCACIDAVRRESFAKREWRNYCPVRCDEAPGYLTVVDHTKLVVVPD